MSATPEGILAVIALFLILSFMIFIPLNKPTHARTRTRKTHKEEMLEQVQKRIKQKPINVHLEGLMILFAMIGAIMIIGGFARSNIPVIFYGFVLIGTAFIISTYLDKLYTKEMKKYDDEIKQKQIEELKLYKLKQHEKRLFERGMKEKGLVKIDRRGKEYWVTLEQERDWKFIDVDLNNNFSKLSPRQFEKVIQDLFIKMSYETTMTNYTGDYGADLVVKKDGVTTVVQCKKYGGNNNVGAPEVQRTLGSMHRYKASKAILITTSDFTRQARTQALNAPIELWNRRKLREQFEKVYLPN